MSPLVWSSLALMLVGVVMLIAHVGAAGLWIAVITVGIALYAYHGVRRSHGDSRL